MSDLLPGLSNGAAAAIIVEQMSRYGVEMDPTDGTFRIVHDGAALSSGVYAADEGDLARDIMRVCCAFSILKAFSEAQDNG